MTYDQALARLQGIIKQLESNEVISVEEYKHLATEASSLLVQCKSQLTSLEEELEAATNADK